MGENTRFESPTHAGHAAIQKTMPINGGKHRCAAGSVFSACDRRGMRTLPALPVTRDTSSQSSVTVQRKDFLSWHRGGAKESPTPPPGADDLRSHIAGWIMGRVVPAAQTNEEHWQRVPIPVGMYGRTSLRVKEANFLQTWLPRWDGKVI